MTNRCAANVLAINQYDGSIFSNKIAVSYHPLATQTLVGCCKALEDTQIIDFRYSTGSICLMSLAPPDD